MVALIDFVDLQDNKHAYHAGDLFPRKGYAVSEARLAELSGIKNALGRPVIGEKPEFPMNPPVQEEPEGEPKQEPEIAETVAEEVAKEPEVKAEKPKRGRKKNAD